MYRQGDANPHVRALRLIFTFLMAILFSASASEPGVSSSLAVSLTKGWPILTNMAQWLKLTRNEVSRGYPLRLEGVLTLVDSNLNLIVLQDATGAVAVNLRLDGFSLQTGQRIVLAGNSAASYLPAFPDYPNRPSGRIFLSSFEAPTDRDLWFASRTRGFLHPPVSGEYTFWIASDNSSELWLSTNADPANARRIAQVRSGRLISTQPREWTKYPSQRSEAIVLQAGECYYLETVHEQGTGADNLAVAWQGPGLSQRVIEGQYLSPWPEAGGSACAISAGLRHNGVFYEYWSNYYVGSVKPLTGRMEASHKLTIREPKVTVIGAGILPKPRQFKPGEVPSPADDFCWGEWEGCVEFAGREADALRVEMSEGSQRMTVRVLDGAASVPTAWREGRIRVRGVCELGLGTRDSPVTLCVWVPSIQDVMCVESAEADTGLAKLIPICRLDAANPELAWGRRIRVRGKLIQQESGNVVGVQGDDSFHGYVSTNGSCWSPVGTPVEIVVSNSIQAGLAVASSSPDVLATATFDQISGLSKSLANADILHFPIMPGSGNLTDSVSLVRGAGRGVRTDSDQLHFYFQPLLGDGEVVARVTRFENPLPQGLAGVMMRESTQQNAAFAGLVVSGTNRVSFQFRRQTSALAEEVESVGHALPCWVKLVRSHETVRVQLEPGQAPVFGRDVEVSGRLVWAAGRPLLLEASLHDFSRTNEEADGSDKLSSAAASGIEPVGCKIGALLDGSAYVSGRTAASMRIRGVITFYDRILNHEYMTVQDETAAIFIASLPGRRNTRPLRVGQRVELDGNRLDGIGGPKFVPYSLNILGWDQLPVPVVHPGEYSLSRHGEGLWTQVEGVVQFVDATGAMTVKTKQETVLVRMPQIHLRQLEQYVDSRVRARGVMTLPESGHPLLLVPSPAFLEACDFPPNDPFELPGIAITAVKVFQDYPDPMHRVKVAGVVTYQNEDLLFVQDETGGVRVRSLVVPSVEVGDSVEVVGFPQRAVTSASLMNCRVRKMNAGARSASVPIPILPVATGHYEGVLVRWKGMVLNQRSSSGEQIIELQAEERLCEAALPERAGKLAQIPVGSAVEVVGVCGGTFASTLPPDVAERNLPANFKLFLRAPADVILLKRPPWWTWKYTAGLVGGMLLILAAALLWIRELHQQVAARTCELQKAMLRLKEETQTSATLAERERLAAEIHDGLQQGLSGIMLQLEGAGAKLAQNPNLVRASLEMARNMAVFCLSEVRHSVLNLQSPLVTEAGLGAALTQVSRQMTAGRTNGIEVEIRGVVRALPPAVEHHLFRVGQESLNNAIKHARAGRIKVDLTYSEESVRLAVADDGCGFVVADVMGPGAEHLGLRTLRGRARKLGGRLEIKSQSGRGTTVEIVVPTGTPTNPPT